MSKNVTLLNIYGVRGFAEEALHFDELITIGVIQRDSVHTALADGGV